MERKITEFGIIATELNCPPDWGRTERCPKCNQFHLRPGYCQTLNPEASAAIASGRVLGMAEVRRLASVTEPVTEAPLVTEKPVTEPPAVTESVPHQPMSNAERQRLYRERQRQQP